MTTKSDVMVSICCATYNHEKYIAQALDGFLMQKTDFNFEVIVHDDASTDGTAGIVRAYAEANSNSIKPIFQTENQYSKGVGIHLTYLWPNAQGKYIAQCEGDDYWTDPYKLQKQVDFMESRADCSLCVHSAELVSAITGKTLSHIKPSSYSRMFSTKEVIEGGGGLFATNSMLFLKECIKELPPFFHTAPVGDYPLTVVLATQGNVYFLEDSMSAYRVNTPGSWSDRMRTIPTEKIQHFEGVLKMFKDIDIYTDGIYSDGIAFQELRLILSNHNYAMACNPRYWRVYNRISLRSITKIFLFGCLRLRRQQ